MKHKVALGIVTLTMSAVMAISLTACNNPSGNDSDRDSSTPIASTDIFGFSASTTAGILGNFGNGSAANTLAEDYFDANRQIASPAGGYGSSPALSDTEIEQISKQLALIESYVGSNPVEVKEEESDKIEYSNKMTISTTDMTGAKTVCIMYYNQTPVQPDIDDDDDDDVNSLESNDLESETAYLLSGIMIEGDKTYTIEGKKEIEQEVENGVTENEYEISFKASIDNLNYVKFKQEIEEEAGEVEEEFKYTVCRDGVIVENFSLELENKNGNQEIEFRSSTAEKNAVRYSKKTENGKTMIKAYFTENGITDSVKVFIEENANGELQYKFMFKDGSSKMHARNFGNGGSN